MNSDQKDYSAAQKRWYHYITVEPPMFLYMMAFMITTVLEQAFYVERTCHIDLGYPLSVCKNLTEYNETKDIVQKEVAVFHKWNSVAAHAVPLFLAFFLGAWSDKRGRKALLIAGFFSKTFFSIMTVINTMSDWSVYLMTYTATLPSAMGGADLAIFAGCFAYVADVSSLEQRTMRVGILDAVYLSTMPAGVALGNFLFHHLVHESYTVMFIINSTLMVMASLYVIIFLKWQTRPGQLSMRDAGVKNPLADIFDMNNVKRTFATLLKKRSHFKRLHLWLLLVSMSLYAFQRDERPFMYLYTQKVLNWDVSEYSWFRTYHTTGYFLVVLFGIPIMSKILHLRDTVIIMLGACSHIFGHLLFAQAVNSEMMYFGATVAALGPCVAPLIRSLTSKLLPAEERGVVYTFLSVMENTVGLFASVIYSCLYAYTVGSPHINAIFYLTMSTQVAVFLLALLIQRTLSLIEDHTSSNGEILSEN